MKRRAAGEGVSRKKSGAIRIVAVQLVVSTPLRIGSNEEEAINTLIAVLLSESTNKNVTSLLDLPQRARGTVAKEIAGKLDYSSVIIYYHSHHLPMSKRCVSDRL